VRTSERCYVTHAGLALRHFRLLEETSFASVPRSWRRHFYRYALYKYFSEHHVTLNDPHLLLIHNHWGYGYHHWLTECLPKATLIDPAGYVVILPADYPAFTRESLEMLAFERIVEIPRGYGVRAAHLTVVGNPHSGRFNPEHVGRLKKRFVGIESPTEASTGSRHIYITRRNEPVRRVENEDEVVEVVRAYEFEVVDPRNLSFREQIRVFGSCEALVSIHGAGLTNCVFMPPGGSVLELYRELTPEHGGMNVCYWQLASAAGLDYYYQFCRHGTNLRDGIDHVNIVVDIEKFQRNLDLMLA
jgi:capsular polysaccharide biosynthesis protein